MPGRTSVRANRTNRSTQATVPRQSSAQTVKSRTSSTRSSAFAVQIPDEGPPTSLRNEIASIFSDAQRGNSTQRKSVVTLRKLQESCCFAFVESRKHGLDHEYEETDFNEEVARCLARILGIRRSEPVGDRLLKFLGLFLKHASEKDNALFQDSGQDASDAFPETPTSRLTSHILTIALQTVTAKDKTVRYRSTQLIAHIVNTLDSIDDQLFHLIRLALLKQLRDKESIVRVQAVLGLGPLADEHDEEQDVDDSDDDASSGVLTRLREALQHDSSADVRRALLLNLPFTPGTLPYLLERARDLDAATRRALYSRLLPALGDFRHLSLTHREKLLRWGLRDRDENVRKATARLFREHWIEDCASPAELGKDGVAPVSKFSEPSIDALMELLERIDVNNSGLENGIAHEAMREFWDGRPDYREYITFDDPFFEELTPESSFVARTFTDFCRKSGDARLQNVLEDKMPEVTKFAFLLQMQLTKLVKVVNVVVTDADDVEAEEDAIQQEFCVEQLLHMAATLDYSDEMGRRKMFQIMREALALVELPEECTRLVVEILCAVSGNEEEFASVVLEAIAEVHDTISDPDSNQAEDDDQSFHSAQSEVDEEASQTKMPKKNPKGNEDSEEEVDEEKAIREIQVNMKCLHIAQCMLQNVQCNLEESSHLRTMLNNLVVPAVRSQEAPIRERGLMCIGLCCLLSKNLSEENLTLFLHCFNKGHEALQDIAIQIISDILLTHPTLLAPPCQVDGEGDTEIEPNPLLKPIFKMYSKGLRSSDSAIQTSACTALSKLMLASTIQEPDLLKQMVLSYFDPETRGNPSLRQSLTYFLPVYCHSRRQNAELLARVAVPVLHALAERAQELEEDEEMVGLNLVAAQISDWTDPRKTVAGMDGASKTAIGEELDGHLVLAEELLEKILTPGCNKDERKTYISLLSKLHIAPTAPVTALQTIFDLINECFESKLTAEASSRNTLTKLQNTVSKYLSAVGSPVDPRKDQVYEEASDPNQDHIVDTTELAGDVAELDGADLTLDMSSMSKSVGMPDAEGTVYGDFDDDDEEELEIDHDEKEMNTSVAMGGAEESLLESLLDDEEDDEDTVV